MPVTGVRRPVALTLTVALHVGAYLAVSAYTVTSPLSVAKPKTELVFLRTDTVKLADPEPPPPDPPKRAKAPPAAEPQIAATPLQQHYVRPMDSHRAPATMDAPPAPTAEEWAFAARYTLRNSKGYRYTWGQQVRSMMGTAIEGPDQGSVRFRVEIAPSGAVVSVQTVWSTSDKAEQLARQAIKNMPPLPPTPTGKPLIFEKTINFSPFATDGPPIYKYDCQPEPQAFRNKFAWDGTSARKDDDAEPAQSRQLSPEEMEECLKQLPGDTIDAEMARDRRLMERWGWSHRKDAAP